MGIYDNWQIHTKTGFRPIKLQESQSGPHTNRTPSNNGLYEAEDLLDEQRKLYLAESYN